MLLQNGANAKKHPLYAKNGNNINYTLQLEYMRTGSNKDFLEFHYTDGTKKFMRDSAMIMNEWGRYTCVIDKDVEKVTLSFSDSEYTYINLDSVCISKNESFVEKKLNKKKVLYFNPNTQTWE